MKILLISDNHGKYPTVQDIINQWRDNVDYIFHTGDSEFPADDPIWENVDSVVSGNMDFDPQYRRRDLVNTPVGKVLIVHGHLYNINHGNQELLELAEDLDAQFVFHGHTHRLYAEKKNNILFINPGSISLPRGEYSESTYVVITIDQLNVNVDFYNLKHQKVKELTKSFKR